MLFVSRQIYQEALPCLLQTARMNFSLAPNGHMFGGNDLDRLNPFFTWHGGLSLVRHVYLDAAWVSETPKMSMYSLLKSLTSLELFEFDLSNKVGLYILLTMNGVTSEGFPNEELVAIMQDS